MKWVVRILIVAFLPVAVLATGPAMAQAAVRRPTVKALLAILAMTAALGGCAQFQKAVNEVRQVYDFATTTTVTSGQAAIIANVYDTLKDTAVNYGHYCVEQHFPKPVCSAGNRRVVIKAVHDGDAVRAQIEAPIAAGQNVPATLYNTLVGIVNTLKSEPITVAKAQ